MTFKENDFVRYMGKPTWEYDPTKEIIAQIYKIDSQFSSLIIGTNKIDSPINLLRPITSVKEHLENLGLVAEQKVNFTIYSLGSLKISSITIIIPQNFINLGFCLGDVSTLSDEEIIKKYFDEDLNFNKEKFNDDYPDLNNLNDLIYEYSKYFDFKIDKLFKHFVS
ncbi:hypothetical protein [Chryseobacterium ginsengisoli]